MEQEHAQVRTSHAIERYLLDEMSEDERLRFEDHFADCRVCSDDVRQGARMMAAGKVVAGEEPRSLAPMWLAPIAASLVGILVGWQGAVRMVPPRIAPTLAVVEPVQIATDQDRAEGSATPKQFRAGSDIDMDLWVPGRDDAASYRISVTGPPDAKVPPPVSLSRRQAEDPVRLRLRGLPRGSYQLLIEGVREDGNRFPITRSAFTVVDER